MSYEATQEPARPLRSRASVTKVALVGDNPSSLDEILAALAHIPEPLVEVVELDLNTTRASGRPPEIVIAALGDDEETWTLQIQELHQGPWRGTVIGAISTRCGDKVRQALRAGAADVFFLPVQPSDLSRCLVRACETIRGGAAHSATICSVTSLAGGVGASSLAVSLGFAALRQGVQRVVLVDLSLQCGTLAAILGLNPESTISELVDPTNTIDSLRLESSLVGHQSGLYLLAAPKRIEESEMVSVNTIAAVLEVMRELFDLILIDCGHHMNEALVAAWEQSTHLLYVVEQSVSSVRPAQRFLEMFERLQLGEIDLQFALNRYDPANPFSAEKIEAALRRPLTAHLPRDDAAFLKFQLESNDLALLAPKSASRLAIDQLAARLSGTQTGLKADDTPYFLDRLHGTLKLPKANLLRMWPPRLFRRGPRPSAADA